MSVTGVSGSDPLEALKHPSSGGSGRLANITNTGTTKDQFLNLLVAQLRYQDPLEPQKGSEFVAQLAQFSSLEAAAQTNDTLGTIATGQVSAQNAALANFIGKTVTCRTDTVNLNGQGPPNVIAHLDGKVVKGEVVVTGPDGRVVRTLQLPPGTVGDVALAWDGKDDNGKQLPAGQYRMELKATGAGGALSGYMQIKGAVTGLEFGAEGARFRVGGVSLSPADITSVNG